MEIIIEDTSVEWTLPDKEVKLKEVIEEMETFLLTVGKVPVALIIDGHSLNQDELDAREEEILTGDEVLEFGVMSLSEFIIENLQGAKEANENLLGSINTFADELYSSNKTVEPDEVIENLRHFFFFWFRTSRLFPAVFEGIKLDGESIDDRLDQMQEIFKEIVSAMEDEDAVLAADLLQYEIVPLVETIGAGVPEFKARIEALNEEQARKDQEAEEESKKAKKTN